MGDNGWSARGNGDRFVSQTNVEMTKFRVTFEPSGKSAEVPERTLILDAAVAAGVLLDTPCGGQERCGRCRVKVLTGEVTRKINPLLTDKQVQDGWALSCVSRVLSDVSAMVPARKEQERIIVETASSRIAVPVECSWPFYPSVQHIAVKLPPASLEDNTSDLERLKRVLKREYGIENLSANISVLKEMPRILREGNWEVALVVFYPDGKETAVLLDIQPGKISHQVYAVSVDIGTTNVVLDLVNLRSGKQLARVSRLNGQVSCGEDVISRIIYSQRKNGVEELQQLVIETINSLLREVTGSTDIEASQIYYMVVAGNTIMAHLFLGISPRHMREEPYTPVAINFPVATAGELKIGINPQAPVYCLPAVAAYVGGDITAGILSSCLFQKEKLTLFLDVGTNGEIVLGNSEWMTACACSAGPAFEGAGVRWGMRGIPGAIEDVRINSNTLEPTISVIDNLPPEGICGSGMISALAELFVTGVVDRAGRINIPFVESRSKGRPRARAGEHGAEYVLVWAEESASGEDIVLTAVDIDNLIRTKGAIYAGISVMMKNVGVTVDGLNEILIGGAFGRHINIEQAIQVGLLPDIPWDKIKYLGNTSALGAYNVLCSRYARAQVEEVAKKVTYLELIADKGFMDELMAAIFLPHTNVAEFPAVKALLERTGQPANN